MRFYVRGPLNAAMREMHGYGPNGLDTMEQHKSEHRALALLRFLDRQSGNVSNECIIILMFDKIGLTCSRQEVRDGLERIEKLGLIQISKIDGLVVVNLSPRVRRLPKAVSRLTGF